MIEFAACELWQLVVWSFDNETLKRRLFPASFSGRCGESLKVVIAPKLSELQSQRREDADFPSQELIIIPNDEGSKIHIANDRRNGMKTEWREALPIDEYAKHPYRG
jgi:hypothetical protein